MLLQSDTNGLEFFTLTGAVALIFSINTVMAKTIQFQVKSNFQLAVV